MNKNISSLPEAAKFRSTLVIIIILICIVSFLSLTDHLSEKAERVAQKNVISDIQYSLSMMLYDYTIKGKQQQLLKFNLENPFIPLAIYRSLPINYQGVVTVLKSEISQSGWYFEKQTRRVIYVAFNDERSEYELRFMKSSLDSVGQLQLVEIKGFK